MAATNKSKATRKRTKPYLEQTGGAGQGRVFELSRDRLSIGRTEDNEIVMKSDSVSRCHAFIQKNSDGKWVFEDNHSKNGILVNGEKVVQATLKDGDQVVVGEFTFRFYQPEPVDSEKTSPLIEALPPRRASPRPRPPSRPVFDNPPNPESFFKQLNFAERYSWLAGLVLGVVLGGGFWWRVSRLQSKPRSQEAVKTVAVDPKPAAPAAASARPSAEPTQETAPSLTKQDLRVSKRTNGTGTEIGDLRLYLREGEEYLKEGDKESAAIAFRFALVIDPKNRKALRGLRLAGVRVETPQPVGPPVHKAVPPPRATASRSALKVGELLKAAYTAFEKRHYQEAIELAEQTRKIEVPGQTQYLNQAKQILDRAKQKQKEDFAPFLESALRKLEQGDFQGCHDLCEEMLRTDPGYVPAKECLAKSKAELAAGRRAK